MKRVFFILFLTVLIFAKDNFVYETNGKEITERIDKIENDLLLIKSQQKLLDEKAYEADENHKLIKINSSKINEIKTINSANAQKISQIADSLSSIKNIMQEAKKMPSMHPSVKVIEMKSDKTDAGCPPEVKKEDIERNSVLIENITDRVMILEKEIQSIELMNSSGEPQKAIYDYFEYFVLITVVLFFLMFIIIFTLSLRIKRQHREMIESLSPVEE